MLLSVLIIYLVLSLLSLDTQIFFHKSLFVFELLFADFVWVVAISQCQQSWKYLKLKFLIWVRIKGLWPLLQTIMWLINIIWLHFFGTVLSFIFIYSQWFEQRNWKKKTQGFIIAFLTLPKDFSFSVTLVRKEVDLSVLVVKWDLLLD